MKMNDMDEWQAEEAAKEQAVIEQERLAFAALPLSEKIAIAKRSAESIALIEQQIEDAEE